ncbi:hypothetical protein BJP37_23080 [Moorena bouillonii PNG]|uniref:Calcium-binding protein n=1 Tax=Moorena bouillonii PNG TaxID=568701 RepID=A0A1U7N695_9CYAN|nr:hypothetical protein BJP37_23080 [Moorena bouillonii PNG]
MQLTHTLYATKPREGNDIIQGNLGNDVIYGDQGDDVIQGNEGNDQLFGGEGDDVIQGGAGNDRIWGDSGNDVLQGGAGHDTFRDSAGVNYFDGGEGRDTVDFQNLINSGIKLNLAEGTGSYTDEQDQEVAQTLISIEKAVGTNFNDELIGNEANNSFSGLDGDDKYVGGAGNDIFRDSAGVNYFDGGEGFDTVNFQDLINSGIKLNLAEGTGSYTDEQDQEVAQTLISIERVFGTNFNDELIGNEAHNTFFGLDGDDTITGGAGNDVIKTGDGNNTIDSGSGVDTIELGNGNNTIALEEGEGHDKVINFQLGLTRFGVSDANTLTFEQSNGSVNIIAADGDLLANVKGVEVSTFTDNLSSIFF